MIELVQAAPWHVVRVGKYDKGEAVYMPLRKLNAERDRLLQV